MPAKPYSEYQMKIRESIRDVIRGLPEWQDADPFTANYLAEQVLARLVHEGLVKDDPDA
jgi:hypothetical protein